MSKLSKRQARAWVKAQGGDQDPVDYEELIAAWRALYEREPEGEERETWRLWTDCVAYVS